MFTQQFLSSSIKILKRFKGGHTKISWEAEYLQLFGRLVLLYLACNRDPPTPGTKIKVNLQYKLKMVLNLIYKLFS